MGHIFLYLFMPNNFLDTFWTLWMLCRLWVLLYPSEECCCFSFSRQYIVQMFLHFLLGFFLNIISIQTDLYHWYFKDKYCFQNIFVFLAMVKILLDWDRLLWLRYFFWNFSAVHWKLIVCNLGSELRWYLALDPREPKSCL